MANNELFYRVAREALDESDSMSALIIDLGTAFESYAQAQAEDPSDNPAREVEEVRNAIIHGERMLKDLNALLAYIEPPEEAS
jgi:hypothetical protein